MNPLTIYLTFNGNCKEAMMFYRDCLGGELGFQMVGETPGSDKLPQKMKDLVLNATLKSNNKVLMATDMVGEDGCHKGNAISILMECRTKTEMNAYYQKLVLGGRATHRIKETFWGDLYGGLTDKYGIHWLFHCKR